MIMKMTVMMIMVMLKITIMIMMEMTMLMTTVIEDDIFKIEFTSQYLTNLHLRKTN